MASYTIELEETHSQNAERLAAACKMPVSEVLAVCLRNRLEELAQQLEKAQGGEGNNNGSVDRTEGPGDIQKS